MAWGRGELWADFSYLVGSTSASIFDEQFEMKLILQTLTFGARYCYPLNAHFVPFLRGGVGASWGKLELVPVGSDAIGDRDAAFSSYLLGGIEFLGPFSWRAKKNRGRVTFGLVLEGGYGFSSRLDFALSPDEDDELQQIPSVSSDLGNIAIRGPQLRVGILLRF